MMIDTTRSRYNAMIIDNVTRAPLKKKDDGIICFTIDLYDNVHVSVFCYYLWKIATSSRHNQISLEYPRIDLIINNFN